MECGLIGLSTVGKSTIFNLLTKGNVEVRKYGGGTADEPNVGVTTVPDPRLDFLTYTYTPKKHTPATVEFVDVAGMVPGKARDGGLSPTLLAALREVDSLLHVVRCFAAE
ncbi:MAG: redox-regulated ATPase YchF, partial [Armatimonadetes bacterium]|nr:redox-regulated ATPase YchF [Armatimonadota bacterium]